MFAYLQHEHSISHGLDGHQPSPEQLELGLGITSLQLRTAWRAEARTGHDPIVGQARYLRQAMVSHGCGEELPGAKIGIWAQGPPSSTLWVDNEMQSGHRTGSSAAEVASLQHEHVTRLRNTIRI